jgi:hypothetical protein
VPFKSNAIGTMIWESNGWARPRLAAELGVDPSDTRAVGDGAKDSLGFLRHSSQGARKLIWRYWACADSILINDYFSMATSTTESA